MLESSQGAFWNPLEKERKKLFEILLIKLIIRKNMKKYAFIYCALGVLAYYSNKRP